MSATWTSVLANMAPTHAQLGPVWEQLRRCEIRLKTHVLMSNVFWASMKLRVAQCYPYCVYVGPNLVRSCRQKVPSCTMLGLLLHSVASTSGLPGRLRPSVIPTWPMLGPKLGPTLTNLLSQHDMAKIRVFAAVGLCWAMFPELGLCSCSCPRAGLSCVMLDPVAPKRAQIPSCAMLDPSWAQVGRGPSRLVLGST